MFYFDVQKVPPSPGLPPSLTIVDGEQQRQRIGSAALELNSSLVPTEEFTQSTEVGMISSFY